MSDTGETLDKHSDAQPTVAPREQHAPGAPASGDGEAPDGAAKDGVSELVADVISDQIGDADESALRGDVDELVAAAAQRDEYLALAQRTQADFENYRKRVARESAAALERGTCALAKELLPALDNLDRALEEADANDADGEDPLLAGVRLVRAELSAALARARIESYSPVGEPFDPALHEAMATAEQPPDGYPSGTVVEVYQPGYRIGTSIIRPARVVVAA
jgi:molecular chaperone GrpE